jgi:hypothetical protein
LSHKPQFKLALLSAILLISSITFFGITTTKAHAQSTCAGSGCPTSDEVPPGVKDPEEYLREKAQCAALEKEVERRESLPLAEAETLPRLDLGETETCKRKFARFAVRQPDEVPPGVVDRDFYLKEKADCQDLWAEIKRRNSLPPDQLENLTPIGHARVENCSGLFAVHKFPKLPPPSSLGSLNLGRAWPVATPPPTTNRSGSAQSLLGPSNSPQ